MPAKKPFTTLQKFTVSALILYGLVLAGLTLIPAEEIPNLNSWDKILHFAGYMNFMLLTLPLCSRHRHLVTALLCVICYGAMGEIAQQFSPGRHTSVFDMLANIAGAIVAYLIGLRFLHLGILGDND